MSSATEERSGPVRRRKTTETVTERVDAAREKVLDDYARTVVEEQRKAMGFARTPKSVSDSYADYMKLAHAYPNFSNRQFRYRVQLWETKLLTDRSVLAMGGVAPDERMDAEEEEDDEEVEVLKTGDSDESGGGGGVKLMRRRRRQRRPEGGGGRRTSPSALPQKKRSYTTKLSQRRET